MSFVVIEGGEGVGKGTLMEGLKRHFNDAVFTREPVVAPWRKRSGLQPAPTARARRARH